MVRDGRSHARLNGRGSNLLSKLKRDMSRPTSNFISQLYIEAQPSHYLTMAMHSRQYIKLAESLPPRLTRFFARYPPKAILPQLNTASTMPNSTTQAPGAPPGPSTPAVSADQINAGEDGLAVSSPFRAQKHPVTGRWHDPVFSLRRQAELVKLARQHGVEDLLPYTVKGTEERLRRRAENGLRVKGTGVGQRVKGKESERTLKGRYVLSFCCSSAAVILALKKVC